MSRSSTRIDYLSLDEQKQIDQICNTFEADWAKGSPFPIEQYVAGVIEPVRTPLLAELVAIDHQHRVELGENPRLQDYQSRFPEIGQSAITIDQRNPSREELVANRYLLMKELAAGGMGKVYLARDQKLERLVALKMILPDYKLDNEFRRRFFREARALAQVHHPHIVQIFDVGNEGDTVYLVMELLQGQSLASLLNVNGRLAPDEVMRIGKELALALMAIHGKGLIHRDLKPANVWIERSTDERGRETPRVKLLDFGLVGFSERAVLSHDSQPITRLGARLGTQEYMSSEQMRDASGADHRTDLYSLGCVLYEAATGSRSFNQDKTLIATTALNLLIPTQIASLITRLLALDPNERPQTATEVYNELSTISGSANTNGQTRRIGIRYLISIGGGFLIVASLLYFSFYFFASPSPTNAIRKNIDPHLVVTNADSAVARWALNLGAASVDIDNWRTIRSIAKLPDRFRLVSINFRDSRLTDAELLQLKNVRLGGLEDINLTGTNVTDKGLAGVVHFRLANLYAAELIGITDHGATEIAKIKSLIHLDLDHSGISDIGLKEIAKLRNLQELHIQHTAISDKGLQHLSSLSNLQHLHLSLDNGITPAGIATLKANLPRNCDVEVAGN